MDAYIDSALLRCMRDDKNAAPPFEIVRQDIGLWVWELPSEPNLTWDRQLQEIWSTLDAKRSMLTSLKNGSADYTLHLSVVSNEKSALRIPNKIAVLAADCGFDIEIYAGQFD